MNLFPSSRRVVALFCLTVAALGAVLPARAQTPQPPEILARQYFLIDLGANQVLAERQADVRAEPASLTKLMTAWLVFDALRARKLALDQPVTVSERAWAERKGGGSLMFIEPKMRPTVDELLHGMIIVSGNDASIALAEAVGGSVEQFVAMMNRQAQAWGLKNTQFRNPTGLTADGHYASARDIATIAAHIAQDFPQEYARYYSQRQYTYNKIRQDNRNMLLGRDPSVDGMKTGHTAAAGYCLVASAQRDTPSGKRRLLSVVLGTAGTEARATESAKLLNWGWTAWDAVREVQAGKPLATVPVWKGAVSEVGLGLSRDVVLAVPAGSAAQLRTTLERPDPLLAPLTAGQTVGQIKVQLGDAAPLAVLPLQSLQAVPQAGWFGRLWDALRLWIK